MHINLRCHGCGDKFAVSYMSLFSIWKEGYEKLSDEQKKYASLTAQGQCPCGNMEKYNGPMFKFLFETVFKELLRQSNV